MKVEIELSRDHLILARLNKPVQDLHAELHPDDFKPHDRTAMEDAFKILLASDHTYAYVAHIVGRPIGYLLCMIKQRPESAFQHERRVLYIDQICINPHYRRQGVGSLLMKTAEDLAKRKDIPVLQMDFWSNNKEAEAFFTEHGFAYFNHQMQKEVTHEAK
jgi:ribosomal protein S18 acetylase RimI-like enzyme